MVKEEKHAFLPSSAEKELLVLHEYDVVKTTKPFSSSSSNAWPIGTDITFPIGTVGTIVMVYTDYAPNYAYEVEFVDQDGGTLALLTLQEDDITLFYTNCDQLP